MEKYEASSSSPEFSQASSPTSPIPMPSSCKKKHCKIELEIQRENDMMDELSRPFFGQQIESDKDIINEAIKQLEINEKISGPLLKDSISQNATHVICKDEHGSTRDDMIDDVLNQEQENSQGSETVCPHEGDNEDYRGQKVRGEPQACLFVASLAASRTDIQLVESVTEHFKKWGPLLNVKVLKDWMQRPYSFVQFEHVEHAQIAMLEAQNTIIDGRHIRIEQARVNRTLFVLRFGRAMTEQDLISFLEQYGPVEDVSIFHDIGSFRNKRYAFAKFAYRDDAIRAYMSLRNNSKWTVEWAQNLSCQNQIEKESVFIGQLNPDLVTEAALRERFQVYGNIKHINLIKRDRPGVYKSSAFAFIEFDNENSAREAIESENGTTFLRTNIRVQYREASEYRMQRQNAAIQAARSLSIPHLINPAPIGAPSQILNPLDSINNCHPYQSSSMEGAMYPTTYYTYPSPGMPMTGMGFVQVPQLGAMYVRQSNGLQRPAMSHDINQGYYHGFIAYNGQAKNVNAEQYHSTHTTDHNHVHTQSHEGIYYPRTVSTQVYVYDQDSTVASTTPNIQLNPAVPPFQPTWLSVSGPSVKIRASTDNECSKMLYVPSSQGRHYDVVSVADENHLHLSRKAT